MTYKELIFKIYKQLIQSNILKKKTNKQTTRLKMGRRLEQTFFQRMYTDDQQAHEKDAQSHQRKANKRFKIQLCFKIQFKDTGF